MTARGRRLVDSAARHACYESLARGLQAGISPAECVRIAASGRPASDAAQFIKAATQISGGGSLAHALRDHRIATAFDVALIDLGEQNGRLDSIVSTLARRYQRSADRVRRIKGKLLLPSFVFGIGLFVGPLPALAGGAIGFGGYLARGGLPLAVLFVLSIAVVRIAQRMTTIRDGALGDTLSGMPAIGPVITGYSRSEFLERLSLFELSGCPSIKAAEETERSLPSFLRLPSYRNIGTDLRYGLSLATTLQRHAVLDQSSFALVSTGEQGGRLAAMLERVAADARERFDGQLELVVTWLPRIVYGFVVAYVVAGVV